jgi:hypothetical protein
MSDKNFEVTNVEHLPEKVELTKNSKGYTWTLGVRGKEGTGSDLINRIAELNKQMLDKFRE